MMDATGMLVVGHGVDLIEVSRIERMLQEHGERLSCAWLARVNEGEKRSRRNRERRG